MLLDDGDRVIGCSALTMGGSSQGGAAHSLWAGTTRYEIGMVLLARFAITGDQGQGLGVIC